jgi:hypothetical protein
MDTRKRARGGWLNPIVEPLLNMFVPGSDADAYLESVKAELDAAHLLTQQLRGELDKERLLAQQLRDELAMIEQTRSELGLIHDHAKNELSKTKNELSKTKKKLERARALNEQHKKMDYAYGQYLWSMRATISSMVEELIGKVHEMAVQSAVSCFDDGGEAIQYFKEVYGVILSEEKEKELGSLTRKKIIEKLPDWIDTPRYELVNVVAWTHFHGVKDYELGISGRKVTNASSEEKIVWGQVIDKTHLVSNITGRVGNVLKVGCCPFNPTFTPECVQKYVAFSSICSGGPSDVNIRVKFDEHLRQLCITGTVHDQDAATSMKIESDLIGHGTLTAFYVIGPQSALEIE